MINDINTKINILKKHKKVFVKYSIFSVLFAFIIFHCIFTAYKYIDIKNRRTIAENREKNLIEIQKSFISKNLEYIIWDIQYLASYNFNLNSLKQEDSEEYKDMINRWAQFSTKEQRYSKITFLDNLGNELIMADYNGRSIKITDENNLNNKSNECYFYKSIKLGKDEIFISQFDFNTKESNIDNFVNPTMRFCTPVFDKNNYKVGIIVINYLGKYLIEDFNHISQGTRANHYLLNDEGEYLSPMNNGYVLDVISENKKENNFSKKYSAEWNKIKEEESGQFYTRNGLFTFQTVYPNKLYINEILNNSVHTYFNEKCWKVVSCLPSTLENYYSNKNIALISFYYFYKVPITYISIIIISLIISILTTSNSIANERIRTFATYDILTNTYNRGPGIEKLQQEFILAKKEDLDLSVCFIDINNLKKVNDNLGHDKGDELIKTVVNVLMNNIKEKDFIDRLGGDEFLIVFPRDNKDYVENFWRKVLLNFNEINKNENRGYLIEVSHGVAELKDNKDILLDEMINIADNIMYEEKNRAKKGNISPLT